jgi:DNA invertase Pin-like site-specific DNA recombinase
MTRVGYARVSTTDQDLTLQREALTAAGCTVIREEKVSGTSTKGRTELATILEFITAGDTLVVTRIDRLARSIADLQDVMRTLKAKGGANLQATEQPISGMNGRGISTARGSACTLVLYGRSPRDWEKTAM